MGLGEIFLASISIKLLLTSIGNAIKNTIKDNPGMFNFEHLMYMAVSGLLTVVMLVLFRRYARTEQAKNKILQLL